MLLWRQRQLSRGEITAMLMPDPLMINAVLENIFGNAFINWEPETLEIELIKLKDAVLSRYGKDELVTNLINAIRAIRSPKSFVLDEWHILEKAMAAITGKPVLFFEAQPAGSLQELFLGIELIKELLIENNSETLPDDLGLSEEAKIYIGYMLLDFGIFYFPFEPYKSILDYAIATRKFDSEALLQVADFKAKLDEFLKDKNAVVAFLKLIEEQPEIDLLAELKNINLFNAVTAVCAYIVVRSHVDTLDSAADRMADNTPRELAKVPEVTTTEQEGISEEIINEIFSFTDSDGSMAVKIAARRANNRPPREGTYIVSKDPDKFDPDHKYENIGGGSGSMTSGQSSGDNFSNPAPSTAPDLSRLVPKNPNLKDTLAQIFANLDI